MSFGLRAGVLAAALSMAVALPVGADMTQQAFSAEFQRALGLMRVGRLHEAVAAYERLLVEEPENERLVRQYGAALRQLGRFEEALDVYARGDEGRQRPRFLSERVPILRQLGRNPEALELCLDHLAHQNSNRAVRQYLLDELLELSEEPALWQTAYQRLKARFDGTPTEAIGWALTELCLRGRQYREAVDVTLRLDNAMRKGGAALEQVARRLASLAQYELALIVIGDAIERMESPHQRREAALFRAELEVDLGRPRAAYEGLTAVATDRPEDPRFYDVQIERARLLAGPLDLPDHAIAIYDTLLDMPTLLRAHEAIRLERAETQLRQRRFAHALSDCRELARNSREATLRERAAFLVGEIFFYQGQIDSAAAAYGEQVEAFPEGFLTNDGLDRIFLFNENYEGEGEALVVLGKVHELEATGDLDGAIALCDSLVTRYAEAPIHDDLLLKTATLLAVSAHPERSISYLDSLSVRYPESRLTAHALQRKGELLEMRLGDPAGALATYEDLLIRYPLSIEALEVRPRVTMLRQEVRS